jgi:predicted ATPase/DNA-binding XRE family transcriptional regulator
MTTTAPFHTWLKQRRQSLDLTQADLAQRVGCASVTIQKIETGQRRPSRQIAARLADALDIAIEERGTFIALSRQLPLSESTRPDEHASCDHDEAASTFIRLLPTPLTPLIGRQRELDTICSRLQREEIRLLTLTGTAGIGKTRLAIEIGQMLQRHFADGVVFILLATLHNPTLLAPAIAQALAIPLQTGGSPYEQLAIALRDRRMLLALDNMEHLIDAAPQIVGLLSACPHLKMLITSRERLRVRGERVIPVTPLALPNPTLIYHLNDLLGVPAVALFVEVAQATNPHFALTIENASAIVALCRRLDGLPLAIELVAARSVLLSPQEILLRLDEVLRMDQHLPRDMPMRQSTLQRALDWSYDLLNPLEQRCFARLAVFEGGCTLEAAQSIAFDTPGARGDPSFLNVITSLADKSLISRMVNADGVTRLTLLEPVRAYSLDQLRANHDEQATRRRHAAYFCALATTAKQYFKGPEETLWMQRLMHDHNNIRATLRWLLDVHEFVSACDLGAALWRFWWMNGMWDEGIMWLEQALQAGTATLPPRAQANALYAIGCLLSVQGNPIAAAARFEQSLALYQALDDQQQIATLAHNLGSAFTEMGHYERARRLLEQALAFDRATGDLSQIAFSTGSLAVLCYQQGDLRHAQCFLEESLSLHRTLGDEHSVALTLSNLSEFAYRQRDYGYAYQTIDEALRLIRSLNSPYLLTYALNNLGQVALALGASTQARRAYVDAQRLLRQAHNTKELVTNIIGFACVAASEERWALAAQLLGAADGQQAANKLVHPAVIQTDIDSVTARVHAHLGAAFEAHWAIGLALSLDQVWAMTDDMEATPS